MSRSSGSTAPRLELIASGHEEDIDSQSELIQVGASYPAEFRVIYGVGQ